MIFIGSPLEQFCPRVELRLVLADQASLIDFSITNYRVAGALVFLTLIWLSSFTIFPYLVNTALQSLVSLAIEVIASQIKDNLGIKFISVLPIFFTYFFFILTTNVFGLVPYSLTLTTQFIVTAILAFSFFFSLNYTGYKMHKQNFYRLFLPSGIPFMLVPLLVPIELISYAFRPLSLSVRLFANMMAGHTLLKVISGFSWSMFQGHGIIYFIGIIPILVVAIILILELAIAFIQTYVFLTLLTMYMHDAFFLN